jgi:hypothetical protein
LTGSSSLLVSVSSLDSTSWGVESVPFINVLRLVLKERESDWILAKNTMRKIQFTPRSAKKICLTVNIIGW